MPRLRALLAILLVGTWCSAAWHADLEAAGMLFEHAHRAHHAHHAHDAQHTHDNRGSDPAPAGADEEHTDVFARDVAQDQVRASGTTAAWMTLLAFATWLVAAAWGPLVALRTIRQRRETDPPLARAWQFVQRCAPVSAAPPALG